MREYSIVDFYNGDWGEALDAILAKAGKHDARIKFPKRKYEFGVTQSHRRHAAISNHNSNTVHPFAMMLEGCRNIEMTAEAGTEFVMTERTLIPLLVSASENITLRGFSIDFSMELYALARTVLTGSDFFELEVEAPSVAEVSQGQLFLNGEPFFGAAEIDPGTNGLRKGTALNFREDYPTRIPVSLTGENRIRFDGMLKQMPSQGMRMVLRCGKRTTPALFFEGSNKILVEDVTVHQTAGMGVIAHTCADLTIRRFRTGIAPGKKRCWSACADALHFVNCRGSLLIEECQLEHQYDDAVNIHGIYSIAERMLPSREWLVKRGHRAQYGVPLAVSGNRFRAVHPNTLATVCEFRADKVAEEDDSHIRILTDSPEAIPAGSALENLDWRFSDIIIRKNIMRHSNPRGILVSAGEHILIEDNQIDVPYAAIYIAGGADCWYESGFVGETIIRNNTIRACYGAEPSLLRAAILVAPQTGGADTVYHGRFVLEGNRFLNTKCTAVFIRNAASLEVISSGGSILGPDS